MTLKFRTPKSLALAAAALAIFVTLSAELVRAHDWEGNVVVLTDSNFDSKVLNSDEVWLVNFYAPWCPHCQRLKPLFEQASRDIRKAGIKNVKLGAIDASQYQSYAQEYKIPGFPTLKQFPAGKKTKNDAVDFKNHGSAESIVAWAKKMAADIKPPPEVVQLTSQAVFKKKCDKAQICVIAFLPKLFDCTADCRKRYVQRLKKVSSSFAAKPWNYLWLEIRAQPELDKALDINDSPVLVALNSRKKAFSRMNAAFSEEDITDFLQGISSGKGRSTLIKSGEIPEIKPTEPWDGKEFKAAKQPVTTQAPSSAGDEL